MLLATPPTDRAAYVDQAAKTLVWASQALPTTGGHPRALRCLVRPQLLPGGGSRQLAAIYASGDRTERLATLDVPTLVIHGRDDTLITPDGGEATAAAIPGAHLLMLADMGHDLPAPLWPIIVGAMIGVSRQGEAG